jgi:GT2 family glycosyltransferase
MAEHPKYSIILPCYNHARYVGAAIESILAQTLGNWELLIVDDGSTDDSADVIQDFARREDRIKFRRQQNAGQSVARNAAIALAAGPWIAFIDSDDLWLPQALELFDQYIAAHPHARFIHGRRQQLSVAWASRPCVAGPFRPCPPGREARAAQFHDHPTGTIELFGRMFITQSCVCCRRELLGPGQAGGYDPALRICEDYDLFLRMSLHCQFEPLGKVTALSRRRHGTNISTQSGYTRMYEAMVLKRFAEQFGSKVQPGVADVPSARSRVADASSARGTGILPVSSMGVPPMPVAGASPARTPILPPDLVRSRLRQLYYAAGRQYLRRRFYKQAIAAVRQSQRYGHSLKQFAIIAAASLLLPFNRNDTRTPPNI